MSTFRQQGKIDRDEIEGAQSVERDLRGENLLEARRLLEALSAVIALD